MSLDPPALSQRQLSLLRDAVHDTSSRTPEDLRSAVVRYLSAIEAASTTKPLIDVPTGRRLGNALLDAIDQWAMFSNHQREHLVGAIAYFVQSDDDEHDFDSPIGFDDDAEIIDAVLAELEYRPSNTPVKDDR